MTLVSVLVPVRDGEAYLDEALRSLAEQTHEDLEVIVVDDGSRDASGDIARDWALRDGRFRLVRHEPLGFVAASQRARAEARGRYVAARGSHGRILAIRGPRSRGARSTTCACTCSRGDRRSSGEPGRSGSSMRAC